MKLLWIATKPPIPPHDGGRLVQKLTLEALFEAGAEVTLVAPAPPVEVAALEADLAAYCRPRLVPLMPRGLLASLLAARPGGRPFALALHDRRAVRRRVEKVLAVTAFDAVHAEQLHALSQAAPAFVRRVPVVLRAQNVESDLWTQTADQAAAAFTPGLRWEASRLALAEGEAVRRAAAAVALSVEDAARLGGLAGGVAVEAIAAPFPSRLPPGEARLAGAPPVVVLGSGGWRPNRDSLLWTCGDVWPAVRRATPGAVLHVFADAATEVGGDGVVIHPPPDDSAAAFAPGSILAVPLRVASGVRMKILEAWARGVPVVATPQAAAGLGAVDGRELLLAGDPDAFAAAVARLGGEPELRARLIAAGHAALAERHRPAAVAERLLAVYRRVAARRAVTGTPPAAV